MKQVSDLTFPNIKLLREECLRRIYEAPLEQVSKSEWVGIRALMIEYIREVSESRDQKWAEDWYHDPALKVIGEDLKECTIPLPKWSAMANWLGSEGIVKNHPILVYRIVSAALQGSL